MSSLNLDPKQPEKQYWKSLEELAETPQFKDYLHREFPEEASELGSGVSRRQFLQVMGAGLALAGVSGCKPIQRPVENIFTYNKMPESLIPGIPQFYATSMSIAGENIGLLVESHEGRPTKIEGNPKHPSSVGATGKFHQASILELYNPERSQVVLKDGAPSTWADAGQALQALMQKYKQNEGEGLRFLTGLTTSPTLTSLKQEILKALPKAKWTVYEPTQAENQINGIAAVTGQRLVPLYHFEKAKRILSIDADFLETEANHLPNAKSFSGGRNPDKGLEGMNRLYVVESQYSITGGSADHRLRVKPSQVPLVLWAIAKELQAQGLNLGANLPEEFNSLLASVDVKGIGTDSKWLQALAQDLFLAKGACLVLVGKHQAPATHALAHILNIALSNLGVTLEYHNNVVAELNYAATENISSPTALAALAQEINHGAVETIIVFNTNPAYNSTGDINFAGALAKVKNSIYLGSELNETAKVSHWSLPESHYLESWGDAYAIDGTANIVQPLIAPLYESFSAIEFLASLSENALTKGHELVKEFWRKKMGGLDFEKQWREYLHEGVIANTASGIVSPGYNKDGLAATSKMYAAIAAPKSGIELVVREHSSIFDGRFANSAWLQELPDPITKLTWDNAVLISLNMAEKLGIANKIVEAKAGGSTMGADTERPMVKITSSGKSIEGPAWVMPGMAEDTVFVTLGYGRKTVGKVGTGTGFDVYPLLTVNTDNYLSDIQIQPTGADYSLACTQDHWSLEGRPIAREGNLEEYVKEPEFASDEKMNEHPPLNSLWDEKDYSKGMQWGMVIDFNTCTGCNTCVVACQAENNIPTVGKQQVIRGREMHWIRLDRYFSGDVHNPELIFQVMTCQQCQNAPCEEVCPVAATVHSSEGLNDMTYNRCIGTRYCSNNCPYKVRRFNFFNYNNKLTDSEKMQKNPDVTVRFRGVMEKCTYCVQRINQARIKFKNLGQEIIPEGAVTPACAQSCPTDAIVFGNINDPESRIAKLKAHPRNYGVLTDLNTKPRTTYLAKVRNPNPAIEKLATA